MLPLALVILKDTLQNVTLLTNLTQLKTILVHSKIETDRTIIIEIVTRQHV